MPNNIGLGQNSVVTVGTSATLLVGPSENRYALILFATNGQRYTLSSKSSVALDQGPTIPTGVAPVILDRDHVGTWLQGEIWAIASAPAPVGFIECLKG